MLQDSELHSTEPANDLEPDEVAHEGPNSVGAILKRTRAQSGYTLDQVSQNLNIRVQHLAAIEESRFGELPGLPYALGFVKAYANFLGLDENAVVTRYKEEMQFNPNGQRLVFPEPVDEARVPKGTLIAVSLAAALAIYGVWYFVSSYEAVKMVTVPAVPDRVAADSVGPKSIRPSNAQATQAPADTSKQSADVKTASAQPAATKPASTPPAPTKSASTQPTTTKPAPAKTETAEAKPAPVDAATEAPKPAPEAAAPAKVAAAEQPTQPAADNTADVTDQTQNTTDAAADQTVAALEQPAAPTASATDESADTADATPAPAVQEPHIPKVYGSDSPDVRVVIKAATDSWVQVSGPNDKILLSRVLQAGDTYRVPDQQGLVMMTGNAGALDITVDGQSIGSLGPLGAVRRGIELAPAALQGRSTAQN